MTEGCNRERKKERKKLKDKLAHDRGATQGRTKKGALRFNTKGRYPSSRAVPSVLSSLVSSSFDVSLSLNSIALFWHTTKREAMMVAEDNATTV